MEADFRLRVVAIVTMGIVAIVGILAVAFGN